MGDLIKKTPWGLVTFVVQSALIVGMWLHTMSVKAEVDQQLRSYATIELLGAKEAAHAIWSAEAVKRIDGKMDDILARIKRMEDHQLRKGEP